MPKEEFHQQILQRSVCVNLFCSTLTITEGVQLHVAVTLCKNSNYVRSLMTQIESLLGCTGENKYKCRNLMKVIVHAHRQFTPGTRIFRRNDGKDFAVS